MSYSITPELAASITDPELAFATTRLLPAWDDIPEEFKKQSGNIYCQLAHKLFFGDPLPDMEIDIAEGFKPEDLNKCVRAHLASFEPKHQHKIAGVAYMISLMSTITPAQAKPEDDV